MRIAFDIKLMNISKEGITGLVFNNGIIYDEKN